MTGTLLDRDGVLQEVRALCAATNDRATIVRIVGPAGIGKTAVLDALAGSTGLVTLRAAAENAAGNATVREALSAAPSLQGATLLIDDFHWIDADSRAWLETLVASGGLQAIVVTDREDVERGPLWDRNVVRLYPLRDTSVRAIASDTAPELTENELDEIVAAARGNPLTTRLLASSATGAGLAHTIEDAIRRRLDALPLKLREIVLTAAFVPEPIPYAVLREASGADAATVDEATAAAADLLVAGRNIRFAHARIGAAVRAVAAGPAARIERRVLEAQCRTDDASIEAIARIVSLAERAGEDAVYFAYAPRFAEGLAGRNRWRAAAAIYDDLFRRAGEAQRDASLLPFIDVLRVLQRDDDAMALLRPRLMRAIVDRDEGLVLTLLPVFWSIAFSLELLDEIDAVLERVDREFPSAQVVNMGLRRATRAYLGDVRAFEALPQVDHPRDHRARALIAAIKGDERAARAAMAEAHAEIDPTARSFAYGEMLGAFLALCTEGPRSVVSWWEDRALRVEGSEDSVPWLVLYCTGLIAVGRWDDALRTMQTLIPTLANRSDRLLAYQIVVIVNALRASKMEESQLLSDLRWALSRGRVRHALSCAVWFAAGCARAQRPLPRDLQRAITGFDEPWFEHSIAGGMTALGAAFAEPLIGSACVENALAAIDRHDAAWIWGLRLLVETVRTRSVTVAENARDALLEVGAPGLALIAADFTGRTDPRTFEIARLTGYATSDREQQLTAREREIAELAARGMTNREIADHAHISERTIEVHLSRVFAKLGIRSRTELAALMR